MGVPGLEQADIFTMWFANAPNSDQPICFYELGRNLAVSEIRRNEYGSHRPCVVGCEAGWKRERDVIIQSRLVMGPDFPIYRDFEGYTEAVRREVRAWHRNAYDTGE